MYLFYFCWNIVPDIRTSTYIDLEKLNCSVVGLGKWHSVEDRVSFYGYRHCLFWLTSSLKKTNVLGHDVDKPSCINIDRAQGDPQVYLSGLSAIADNPSLEAEVSRRIGMATTTLTKTSQRMWTNTKLTKRTKVQVYKACHRQHSHVCKWTVDTVKTAPLARPCLPHAERQNANGPTLWRDGVRKKV